MHKNHHKLLMSPTTLQIHCGCTHQALAGQHTAVVRVRKMPPSGFQEQQNQSPVPIPTWEQQVPLRKREGSNQKENTVGDIFKNSYLFQTQQAEISWI